MMRRKTFWIVLFVIALVIAGGYYYYSNQVMAAESADAEEPAMQTAVARRGDLEIFASGAGSVVPASEIALGFDESGTLIELNFRVGDKVSAGELLARLQTNNSPESIQASITDAELAVLESQNALEDLYTNAELVRTTALNDIAVYAQAVRDAQYQLENYTIPTYLQGMDAIEGLDLMKQQLDAASAEFEPYKYFSPNNETRRELLEDLNDAQSNYDAAVKRLNYEYELEVAEANLQDARSEYEKYKDGPAPNEVELAEAELANAKAKLELAKEAQSVINLTAPMDGTVMTMDANVGEVVSTTPIITLADLEQPLLEVYLDETDLDKVAVGYDVEAEFDAIPGKIFNGSVVSVSPSLETVSNVPAVKAYVLLNKEEIDPSEPFPVGMNGTVDIIAGRAENAVLVPVEALRELGPNEYAVFVVQNGEPILRVVEVGLIDVTSAEIISGLEAGEIVSTGIVQTE